AFLTMPGTAATAEQPKLAGAVGQGLAAVADADVKKAARVLDAFPPQAGWLRVVRNPNILPIHYDKVTVKFDAACIELRTERETTADFLDRGLHAVYSVMVEALDTLESFMDGSMFGPDEHWPWRDLTRYPPDRQRDLPLLAEARLHFSERYQAMVNLFNACGLLSAEASGATDQGVSEQELAQRRARTDAVMSALNALSSLPASPAAQYDRWIRIMTVESVVEKLGARDDHGAKVWEEKRRKLIGDLQIAAVDITDTALRALLEQVSTVLLTFEGPWEAREQWESRTRMIAVAFAIESIGAFRRGERLPAPSRDYDRTLGDVSDFIDQWNNSGS
ncbi:hypothetical protein AB0K24_53955, partial [Streptomyces mirabilis]